MVTNWNIWYTYRINYFTQLGRDSSVGVATGYGLDGPGIEARSGEIFLTGPDRPYTNGKGKGKVIPLQAYVAQRVGRGIALLFHDRSTRRGWVASSTPRPHFTPAKDPVPILQQAGWAPGPVWTGEKSRPHRDSISDPAARSSVAIPTELPGPPYTKGTGSISQGEGGWGWRWPPTHI